MARIKTLRREWLAEDRRRNEDDYLADMPPLIIAESLVDLFFKIGPVMVGPMGNAPITQMEIACYQFNQGARISSWTCDKLRELSMQYLATAHEAENIHAAAPWTAEKAKAAPTANQLAMRALANL